MIDPALQGKVQQTLRVTLQEARMTVIAATDEIKKRTQRYREIADEHRMLLAKIRKNGHNGAQSAT